MKGKTSHRKYTNRKRSMNIDSTLGELGCLPGLLETILLPLNRTGIPREHPLGLQWRLVCLIDLHQCPGNAQHHGLCLRAQAPAVCLHHHVILAQVSQRRQGKLHCLDEQRLVLEVVRQGQPVHDEVAVALNESHASHSRLAPPSAVDAERSKRGVLAPESRALIRLKLRSVHGLSAGQSQGSPGSRSGERGGGEGHSEGGAPDGSAAAQAADMAAAGDR